MANNLTQVIFPTICVCPLYIKGKRCEVIAGPCAPCGTDTFLLPCFLLQDNIANRRTGRHIQKWDNDHQVDVKWPPSLPQSADLNITELLWDLLVSRVKSGFPLPSSLKAFPSSMKGNHPITYSPGLVKKHSVRYSNHSGGWRHLLISHLMFKHC